MANDFGVTTTLSDGRDAESGPPPLYVARSVTSGASLVLDWNVRPSVVVGKSPACDLVLPDPRVSRRHFSLSPRGHSVLLTDLGATNGTRIGGVRVLEALLVGGETIEIGDTALRVVRAGHLAEAAPRVSGLGRMIGASPAMVRVWNLAERLAGSQIPVVLEGETGTGKALLAEAIHDAGPAARGPFVVFDPSAHAPDTQVLALSAAVEQAWGGTILVDDVADLSEPAQLRLASILEREAVQRPSGEVVRVSTRLLSATTRDLEQLVERGGFREELLFRIGGARLPLPPLRERAGDVALLAAHFWTSFGGAGDLPRTFLLQLEQHGWPGNVRELEHAVARRVTLGDELAAVVPRDRTAGDVVERVLGMGLALPHARQVLFEEFEQRYVARAIAEHGGNVSRAAAASGVTRRYFHMIRSKKKR